MIVYTAPEEYSFLDIKDKVKIFLAGSITGASPWQEFIIDELVKQKLIEVGGAPEKEDLVIFNPLRKVWDDSWDQSINNPEFNTQVNWELDSLEKSNIIIMYLDPNTYSPISLMELGLFIGKKAMIICCPDGFWRKGNVDILAKRNNISVITEKELIVAKLVELISKIRI